MTATDLHSFPPPSPPASPPTGSPPDPPRSSGGSPAARAVWITLGGILAIAALGWGTYNVISLLAHEERTERETYAVADVDRLEIDNGSGSVSIVASDSDTVEVVAEISDGWHTTHVASEVVNGSLVLEASCPPITDIWCRVDYTVSLPADRPVQVNGSGSVRVRGMAGPLDVDSDDGRIELDDVSGDVIASNDNGRIVGRRLTAANVEARNHNGSIELSFLDPPQAVTASTSNGSIEVVVPDAEVLYRVELSTSHGGTDNAVRTDPASDHVIDLSTRNGSVTVRPPG